MSLEYRLKEPIQLDLSPYDIEGKACTWYDFEHPMHRMPPFDQVFSYYWNDYHYRKWIRPGMTCVDIGAHIGDTTLPMMLACQATVLAVEPNIYMLPFLEKNCEANREFGRFVIATEAVTTEVTEDLVFGDHNNAMINGGILDQSWDAGTASTVKGMTGNTVKVKGMPFLDICKKYLTTEEIDCIGFVKIDTEGHDIAIIQDMRDFLIEHKPVLLTEWFFGYSAADSKKLFDAIQNAGYVPHNPVTMELADLNNRCEDLLCIHQDNL
jgi:FkbM family methyltransferase